MELPYHVPAEIPVCSALYDLLPGRHLTIAPTTIPAPWVQPLRDFVAALPQSERRMTKDAEYFCIERLGSEQDHLYVSEVHPEFNPYRYSVEELEAPWDPDDCWFMDRWPCRLPAAKLLEEATRKATQYYPFPKWVAWCAPAGSNGIDSCCIARHTTEQYADRCAAARFAGLEYVLERYIHPNPLFFRHDENGPSNTLRITRRAAPWWCRTLRHLIREHDRHRSAKPGGGKHPPAAMMDLESDSLVDAKAALLARRRRDHVTFIEEVDARVAVHDLLHGRDVITIACQTIPRGWVAPLRQFVAGVPPEKCEEHGRYLRIERAGRLPDYLYVVEVTPEYDVERYVRENMEVLWDPADAWYDSISPCSDPSAVALVRQTRDGERQCPLGTWRAWRLRRPLALFRILPWIAEPCCGRGRATEDQAHECAARTFGNSAYSIGVYPGEDQSSGWLESVRSWFKGLHTA